jgi:hypothetical protein
MTLASAGSIGEVDASESSDSVSIFMRVVGEGEAHESLICCVVGLTVETDEVEHGEPGQVRNVLCARTKSL